MTERNQRYCRERTFSAMKVRMREPGRRGHQTLVKLYASDRTARRQLQGHVAGGIRREPSRLRLDLSSALSEMLDRHGQQDSDGDECERYDPQRHGRDTDSFLGPQTEAVRTTLRSSARPASSGPGQQYNSGLAEGNRIEILLRSPTSRRARPSGTKPATLLITA